MSRLFSPAKAATKRLPDMVGIERRCPIWRRAERGSGWAESPSRSNPEADRHATCRCAHSPQAESHVSLFARRPDDSLFRQLCCFFSSISARLFSESGRARLGASDPYAAIFNYIQSRRGSTLLDQLLFADTKTYLHELLMKQDQMSMAASIESRVPFLDHPLMEFASQLPRRMKLRGPTTKYVLREAMRGFLPNEILSRPKMGFPVPVGAWFRTSFRPLLDESCSGIGPRHASCSIRHF